jgi:hypothetical protein
MRGHIPAERGIPAVFLAIILLLVPASSMTLTVNNVSDALATPSNCLDTTKSCNLRSAWEACATSSTICSILLPDHSQLVMSMGGGLELNEGNRIHIQGGINSSVVVRQQRFINYQEVTTTGSVPTLSLSNFTIQGSPGAGGEEGGGGLYLSGDVSLTISSVAFVDLASSSNGGGVFLVKNSNPVMIEHCSFTRCSAGESGGALYADHIFGSLIIASTFFTGCSAPVGGGAVYWGDDNRGLVITDSVFEVTRVVTVSLWMFFFNPSLSPFPLLPY